MNKSDPNLVPPREYQDRYTELLQQASLSRYRRLAQNARAQVPPTPGVNQYVRQATIASCRQRELPTAACQCAFDTATSKLDKGQIAALNRVTENTGGSDIEQYFGRLYTESFHSCIKQSHL